MEILVVRKPVDKETLGGLAKGWHRTLVKGIADIKTGLVALGGEWHKDAREILIKEGSRSEDMWGFNLYPDQQGDKAIEYHSHINIRPLQGNFTLEITNDGVRRAVRKVVALAVPFLDL